MGYQLAKKQPHAVRRFLMFPEASMTHCAVLASGTFLLPGNLRIVHSVRTVIWAGMYAHAVLFGVDVSSIEFPDLNDRLDHSDDESLEKEPLESFVDVDYKNSDEDYYYD